jgi:hypothetical protein
MQLKLGTNFALMFDEENVEFMGDQEIVEMEVFRPEETNIETESSKASKLSALSKISSAITGHTLAFGSFLSKNTLANYRRQSSNESTSSSKSSKSSGKQDNRRRL